MNIISSDKLKEAGTEFVVNHWKVELVETFFQINKKKHEVVRKPPLVFEDCDVSNICVSSDDIIDTVNNEDSSIVDVGSRFGKLEKVDHDFYERDERKLIRQNLKVVEGNLISNPEVEKFLIPSVITPVVEKMTIKPDFLSGNMKSVDKISYSSRGTLVNKTKDVTVPATPDICTNTSKIRGHTTSSSISTSTLHVDAMLSGKLDSVSDEGGFSKPVRKKNSVMASGPISLGIEANNPIPILVTEVSSSMQFSPAQPVSSSTLVSSSIPVPSSTPVPSTTLVSTSTPVSSVAIVAAATPVSSTVVSATQMPIDVPVLTMAAAEVSTTRSNSFASLVGSSEPAFISSSISTTRPTLIKKSSHSVPPVISTDQGRNCVSVILKSSRLEAKAARLNTVAKGQRQVEQLVSCYSLKFSHKSSPGVQVRLDYCFHQPADVRQFVKSVYSVEQTHSPPRLLSCILMSEAELGYQHQPVLTEHDLLAIQSSEYCRNLFRTCILIKVVQEEDTVAYHFKTVTDVNRFLFNKSGSSNTRSLGLLRMNVVPKKLVPDEKGFFRLFTAESKISEKFSKKHKFMIVPRKKNEKGSLMDGNLLLFSSKFDLFRFLVSEDAADIDHLQFDEKKIQFFEGTDTDRKGQGLNENEKSWYSQSVRRVKESKETDSFEVNYRNEPVKSNLKNEKQVIRSDILSEKDAVHKGEHNLVSVSKSAVRVQFCSGDNLNDYQSNQDNVKVPKNVFTDQKEKLEIKEMSALVKEEPLKEAKQPEEEVELIKSALAQKDEEIRSLKKKLTFKEKMIQNEILEKTNAKSNLEEALSQLDKINQLSLSVAGKSD